MKSQFIYKYKRDICEVEIDLRNLIRNTVNVPIFEIEQRFYLTKYKKSVKRF